METKEYYLAIDIGASGGRHILGFMSDGRMQLKEIYRFENSMTHTDGHLCWDTDRLFNEILNGMKKCHEEGMIPKCLAIDTWAVDYVLTDDEGKTVGRTYGYRDHRTGGADEIVEKAISSDELYERTGIQKQPFNTIYQLAVTGDSEPEVMGRAKHLLLLPDYFNYRLTGRMMTEYTNATTTSLVSTKTGIWDDEIISLLGIPRELFGDITMAGTHVGHLTDEIKNIVGYDTTVVQAASHDTASAVAAVPSLKDDFLYISSGTWSLMGTELNKALVTVESRDENFTNEGGYEYRFRFLKNIMGLWMIQSVRHEYDDRFDFSELCDMAEASDISSIVDVNDDRFLSPNSMTEEIKSACFDTGQQIPETPGDTARIIYRSLAKCYAKTATLIERLTGNNYPAINIVGGGAKADYLCRLTHEETGKPVYAGPSEGTAVGNLLIQMISDGVFTDLMDARRVVSESFDIKLYG